MVGGNLDSSALWVVIATALVEEYLTVSANKSDSQIADWFVVVGATLGGVMVRKRLVAGVLDGLGALCYSRILPSAGIATLNAIAYDSDLSANG